MDSIAKRASGVYLRAMTERDLGCVWRFREVVGWEADPRAFGLLRGMRDARWVMAEEGGEMVGMAGAVPLGEVGIVCHLAVRLEYRRLGIGGELARWAVRHLRSRGARLIRLDATAASESLYESLGFVGVGRRILYRGKAGEVRMEAGEGVRMEPLTVGDLTELYGVDGWAYGALRSALIVTALALNPGGGLVARDGAGQIRGYLLRGLSAEGHWRLGPFVACGHEVARALLCRTLEELPGGAVVEAITPGDGPRTPFEELGFTGYPDRLRMELGQRRRWESGLGHYATTMYLAT